MPWKELPHTADAGLEIEADSAEGLVLESAKALYSFMFGEFSDLKPDQEDTIKIESLDLLELFVSWLNELLYIYDVRERIFYPRDVRIDLQGMRLSVNGNLCIPPKPVRAIKAVTYGSAEITTKPTWRFRVYLDL